MNKRKILYIIALILSLMFICVVAFNQIKASKYTDKNEDINAKKVEKEINEVEVIIEEKSELEIAQEEYDAKLSNLNSKNLSQEEWFKQYKLLVEEYSDVLGKPESIYDKYTDEELDLLFRVVQAEIGCYSFEQKCNVVSVIYNRINDYRFGDTINEILVGHQFSTISNGAIYRVTVDERTKLACEYVHLFGDTANGALFFDSNGKLNYKFLFNDGAHNFYTKRR